MSTQVEPASFRDPSGFVFYRDSTLFRQVQQRYRAHYDRLIASGLYDELVRDGLLVSHSEEPLAAAAAVDAYRILRPERVPFISYPYEWCFSQLQDAALATLQIQKAAIQSDMSLKDASAYNIQFRKGRPVLIDTLSFERYEEGLPWIAYRQFCQHFLAPLALVSQTDVRLGRLMRSNIDGIPLDLASRLLPRATWLSPGLLMHIHLHGAAQRRAETLERTRAQGRSGMSRTAMQGLIDSLESTVKRLSWRPLHTTWSDYYTHTNYSARAMEGKRDAVGSMMDAVHPSPSTVWDLGANTGQFSRLATVRGAHTVAWDIDPGAVEKSYLECRETGDALLLPLLGDLTNPSPDLGWELRERRSMVNRGPVDLVLALALVHHLAIANNVPIDRIAAFFATLGRWLIVEFVPKDDSQAQRLLANREDVFERYSRNEFEKEFRRFFEIVRITQVPESDRTLYLMRRCNE